jgi:hypothetical protein
MHYLLRFQTHDQSSQLEGKLMDKANQIMNELSEKGSVFLFCLFLSFNLSDSPPHIHNKLFSLRVASHLFDV